VGTSNGATLRHATQQFRIPGEPSMSNIEVRKTDGGFLCVLVGSAPATNDAFSEDMRRRGIETHEHEDGTAFIVTASELMAALAAVHDALREYRLFDTHYLYDAGEGKGATEFRIEEAFTGSDFVVLILTTRAAPAPDSPEGTAAVEAIMATGHCLRVRWLEDTDMVGIWLNTPAGTNRLSQFLAIVQAYPLDHNEG
jgi:hypothetical protein